MQTREVKVKVKVRVLYDVSMHAVLNFLMAFKVTGASRAIQILVLDASAIF